MGDHRSGHFWVAPVWRAVVVLVHGSGQMAGGGAHLCLGLAISLEKSRALFARSLIVTSQVTAVGAHVSERASSCHNQKCATEIHQLARSETCAPPADRIISLAPAKAR